MQKFRSSHIKRRGHTEFSTENMRILGSCLKLLGSGVGSGFCVVFHLSFTILAFSERGDCGYCQGMMSVKRPSYLMSDTNIAVDNKKTREYIPQQQQLGQIIITVLFISRLGLHSQACQSVYRLGNYWFHDTKLVEGF